MKYLIAAVAVASVISTPSFAAPSFSDTFESGVSGSVWTKWTGANDNLVATDTAHNITPAGSKSARVFASDPAAWNGYADFGAWGGKVIASVWLYEDFSNNGTNGAQPVTNMFSLYGNSGTGPNAFTDYIQLGVVPFYPGGSQQYGFRTRYNDVNALGIINTGVNRKAGWTKLGIEVDPVSAGGQVRFYIDGNLVGSSQRHGADLRWVRIGNNSKSYENFWYDDVNVVPEPASMVALGAGLVSMLGLRRKRS